jgi:NADH-quinone oxidoreductase subunit C
VAEPDVVAEPDDEGAGEFSELGEMAMDPIERRRTDESQLAAGFGRATGLEAQVSRDGSGTPVVDVPVKGWAAAAQFARERLGLDFFDWLSAVDASDGDPPGVEIVLHVVATASAGLEGDRVRYARRDFSPRSIRRLLLRTWVSNAVPELASLTGVWPGAAWHERETHEMFGVTFTGFDDGTQLGLRPLLLPEGFEGTPLRKSFVLAARAAKEWPGAKDPADSAPARAGRASKAPARRKMQPPGVPEPTWGPRREGEVIEAEARPARGAARPAVKRAVPRKAPAEGEDQ